MRGFEFKIVGAGKCKLPDITAGRPPPIGRIIDSTKVIVSGVFKKSELNAMNISCYLKSFRHERHFYQLREISYCKPDEKLKIRDIPHFLWMLSDRESLFKS